MQNIKTIWPWALFLPYLGYYAYFEKYLAAPPEPMTLYYVMTTGLIILLSAIIPFVASWFLIRRMDGMAARLVIAAIVPAGLCALGYALYWVLIIAPNPDIPVPLSAVLPRSVTPGLVMGVILASWTVFLRLGESSEALPE